MAQLPSHMDLNIPRNTFIHISGLQEEAKKTVGVLSRRAGTGGVQEYRVTTIGTWAHWKALPGLCSTRVLLFLSGR